MATVKPKLIFCVSDSADKLMKAAKLENLNTIFVSLDEYPGLPSLQDILSAQSSEDVANFKPTKLHNFETDVSFAAFTSGSTGFPKTILYSYKYYLYNFMNYYDYFPVKNSRNLWYSDMSRDTMFLLSTIFFEGVRIFHKKFEIEETLRVLEEYKVILKIIFHTYRL